VAAHRSAGLNSNLSGDRAIVADATGEFPRAALDERGDGRPLLLLHGWGVSSELFTPILDALQQGRRLIVPDLPGFGATPEPDTPWSVHDYAAWCIALLDRLGIERCDLIGHSNGGRIGIVIAATYPGRIDRMVLAGSAGIRPRRTLGSVARVRSYKALRMVERSGVLPRAVRDAARRRADLRGSADYRAVTGVMRGTLVRIVNEDLRAVLPNLHLPVLLIWGDKDTETPIGDGQLMERLIPDAGLVVFEGTGHYAYLEQAARFCTIVEVFLRDDPPEPAQ
jgi:pimeloyl-ACP methyl ester carboxylesterase